MNKKLMLALAALLGFSAACSSVKNAPKGGNDRQEANAEAAVDSSKMHRIIVMYGVRRPIDDSVRMERMKQAEQSSPEAKKDMRVTVDPVSERPADD